MRSIIALTTLAAALFAAPALAAPVQLTLSVTQGSEPFAGKLTTQAGQVIDTALWQMYISNVALVKPDGSEVRLPGLSLLKLGGDTGYQNVLVLRGNVPAGQYRGVRFDVGVPRDLNHRDASTQKAPLGLDVGMFWSWNPGYIFSRYEGKALVGGQALDVALHMGADTRRLTVNLSDLMKPTTLIDVKDGQTTTIPVTLNAARMVAAGVGAEKFDLNDKKYVQVHGGPVADQLYLNLAGAFSLSATK